MFIEGLVDAAKFKIIFRDATGAFIGQTTIVKVFAHRIVAAILIVGAGLAQPAHPLAQPALRRPDAPLHNAPAYSCSKTTAHRYQIVSKPTRQALPWKH